MRYAFWRVSCGRPSRGVGVRRARRQSATTAMAHAPTPSIVLVVGIPHSVCGRSFLRASTAQRMQGGQECVRGSRSDACWDTKLQALGVFLRVLALELRVFDVDGEPWYRRLYPRLRSSADSFAGTYQARLKAAPQGCQMAEISDVSASVPRTMDRKRELSVFRLQNLRCKQVEAGKLAHTRTPAHARKGKN